MAIFRAFLLLGTMQVDAKLSILCGLDFLDVNVPETASIPDGARVDTFLFL